MNDINITKPTDFSEWAKNDDSDVIKTTNILHDKGYSNNTGAIRIAHQNINYLMKEVSRFILEKNKYGVASWDSSIQYEVNSIVWFNDKTYFCTVVNTNSNPELLIAWQETVVIIGIPSILLNDINNVNITIPLNNQILTYKSSSNEYINETFAPPPLSLSDFTDGITSTPVTNGSYLMYKNEHFEVKELNANPRIPIDSIIAIKSKEDIVIDATGTYLRSGVIETNPSVYPDARVIDGFNNSQTVNIINIESIISGVNVELQSGLAEYHGFIFIPIILEGVFGVLKVGVDEFNELDTINDAQFYNDKFIAIPKNQDNVIEDMAIHPINGNLFIVWSIINSDDIFVEEFTTDGNSYTSIDFIEHDTLFIAISREHIYMNLFLDSGTDKHNNTIQRIDLLDNNSISSFINPTTLNDSVDNLFKVISACVDENTSIFNSFIHALSLNVGKGFNLNANSFNTNIDTNWESEIKNTTNYLGIEIDALFYYISYINDFGEHKIAKVSNLSSNYTGGVGLPVELTLGESIPPDIAFYIKVAN